MRVSFVEPLPHLRRLFASMVVSEAEVDIEDDIANGDAWVVSVEREPQGGPRPWREPGAVVVWTTRTSDDLASRGIAPDAVVVARPFPAEALRRALRDARASGEDARASGEILEEVKAEPVGENPAQASALPPQDRTGSRQAGAQSPASSGSLFRKVPAPQPPPAPPAAAPPVVPGGAGSAPSDAPGTSTEDTPLRRFSMALAKAMGVPEAYEVVIEQVEEAQAKAGVLLVHAPGKGDPADMG